MKFKIGDKVRIKHAKNTHGVVVKADAKSHAQQGIFMVPVQLSRDSYVSFYEKESLEIINEPNEVLKEIL